MDPQVNQPQNPNTNPTPPNSAGGPPTDPMGNPVAAPVPPSGPSSEPSTTAAQPAPGSVPMPEPIEPARGAKGLPMGLLIVAAVILIGVIVALVFL